MGHHYLRVTNFENLEVVDYPLIKVFGCVNVVDVCPPSDIVKFSLNSSISETKLFHNTFKFLLPLTIGKNFLDIEYCCDRIDLVIEYSPNDLKFSIIPLYVICEGHDGRFQAPVTEINSIESACKRIDLCIQLLQCLTAEKLYDHNLGRKTFRVHSSCQVFRSKLNYLEAKKMTQLELWHIIGEEIMKTHNEFENKKYLAFLSCTRYCGEKYSDNMQTYEELIRITEGYIALGGGHLALFGTACLYTWPENFDEIANRFADNNLIDRRQFLDDSCYRGTLGSCFSTTLGSVLHELYHTFNLGHTKQGIMARGFDNIYKFFVNQDLLDQKSRTNILDSYLSKIEFKEELRKPGLSNNSTALKKDFILIKKTEEIDDTDLTKSCAVLLYFHKWFNNIQPKQSSQLTFDITQKLVKSTSGIRVIEIRTLESELVLYDWVFVGRVLKFSFQIPENVSKEICDDKFVLLVEDNVGNILKADYIFT